MRPARPAPPELLPLLRAALLELSIPPPRAEALLSPLLELADLTAAWAERMNLTGHRGPEEILLRLVIEALALGSFLGPASSVADLGSGAGFPGIPLALLWPESRVTLVESRERRHFFQRAAARALGLKNVQALRGRAESLPTVPHALVIAQALGPAEQAIALMARWSAPGARLALPCGPTPPRIRCLPDGLEAIGIGEYRVPVAGQVRLVWMARRTGREPVDSRGRTR